MKKTAWLLLFNGLIFNAFCQTDSLETAILSYENKQVTLVYNGRAMLTDAFLDGDLEKVGNVLHYLETQVENEDYIALYDLEKWVLYLWTAQYHKVLPMLRHYEPERNLRLRWTNRRIEPMPDLLAEKLLEKTEAAYPTLLAQLEATSLAPAEKSFLKMFLGWILFESNSSIITADQLNEASNDHLQRFPNSDFRDFVGKFINQEVTLSKRGLGFEFFSGYGIYGGGLRENFGHHIPLGVAFDFYYKKWVFGFRDHIGIGKTDKAIDFEQVTWEKRETFNHFLIELSIAHEVLDNERWKIFPFAGVTFSNISPTEAAVKNNPALDGAELKWHPLPVAGVNFDLKLNSPYSQDPKWRDGYGILRVRAGFCPTRFDKKLPGMDGSTVYLTVGIGGVARRVVKKYVAGI
jgi:hypothetical protein